MPLHATSVMTLDSSRKINGNNTNNHNKSTIVTWFFFLDQLNLLYILSIMIC